MKKQILLAFVACVPAAPAPLRILSAQGVQQNAAVLDSVAGAGVRLVREKGTTYRVDLPGARGTWEFKLGPNGKTAQLVHIEPGLELVFERVP